MISASATAISSTVGPEVAIFRLAAAWASSAVAAPVQATTAEASGAAAKVIVGHRPEAGERIVIVDDVMTTGATLESCTRELKRAGIGNVSIWVVARAPPP